MSSRSPYEKAQTYNLSKIQVDILFRVTGWFNGYFLESHNRKMSIGTDYEPTLRRIMEEKWEPAVDHEHELLVDRGIFKDEDRGEDIYVAGRRCQWSPTEKCMRIIEHIFSHSDNIYPKWALDEHTRPPTFRDGSELMEHRKGTMAAASVFSQLERCTGIDVYPRVNLPQRPDLRLWSNGTQLARVEVLTAHRNTESWETKFRHWSQPKAGPTIWIFPNRQTMIRFWNHLITHGFVELDGGRFGGDEKNWAPKRVNDRLHRTSEGAGEYNSIDACWTIAGLIEASHVDAFEFLKRSNIILRS